MAEETLTAAVETRGARRAARQLEEVADAADDIGGVTAGVAKTFGTAADQGGMFSRALTLLGTRMGMIIIVAGVLAVALGPALVAATALGIAALAAMGGVATGIGILAAGVFMRFKAQADKAGTAAHGLRSQLNGMKKTFGRALAPGADAVMRALTKALVVLEPTLALLKGPMTAFGRATGKAIGIAAQAVQELGPEFTRMLTMAAKMLPLAARSVGPFMGTLIDLAIAGMPVLRTLLTWFVKFMFWLRPAVRAVIAFEQRTGTLWKILKITGRVFAEIAKVLADLAVIFYGVYQAAKPVLQVLGIGFLVILKAVAWAIDQVRQNMQAWGPIFAALALYVAILFLPFYGWIVLIVAGIIGLYHKWDWFHRAVNNTATFVTGTLIPALKSVWEWIKRAFGNAVDFVKPKIEWLIDKIKWIVGKADAIRNVAKGQVPRVANVGGKKSGLLGFGGLSKFGIGGNAAGGTVGRSGPSWVGERGPEVVNLRRGDHVTPNHALGGPIWIAATFVTPDGQVLAKQTIRAARKAQSVR